MTQWMRDSRRSSACCFDRPSTCGLWNCVGFHPIQEVAAANDKVSEGALCFACRIRSNTHHIAAVLLKIEEFLREDGNT